jgi:dTDP-4-amino-4,6-dideoxygalactose transaminase
MSAGGERPWIFLSAPHMSGDERKLVDEVFDMNYVAPAGPMIPRFEKALSETTGHAETAALSSGTAAMHLALRVLGIGAGDEVWTSSLTFIGGVAPILYERATPVFLDVSPKDWTLDVGMLSEALKAGAKKGKLPKAVLPVDIYGQSCDLDSILELCGAHDVPVVVDSAEAMGASYRGRHAGKGALLATYSFNGNKIITTSGGGALAGDNVKLIEEARKLSQQAREPYMHYEHQTYGYNYRLSGLCAAVGVGQLRVLSERVARRRAIFARYKKELGDLPGISFMPEADYGVANRWLTVIMLDEKQGAPSPEELRLSLDAERIEARPVWKPMHQQPVFRDARMIGGKVSEGLFKTGLCLPSGTIMSEEDLTRVIATIRAVWSARR